MRLLLDTQAFIWWVQLDRRLSVVARNAIAQETASVHVSVATAWEISIKVGQGKWPEAVPLLAQFEATLIEENFELLLISVSDVRVAGLLQSPHKDPFDRLIVAQAINGELSLITSDAKLNGLGAPVIW